MEDIKGRLKAVRASVAELAIFMEVDYHVADRIVNAKRKHLTTIEAESIERFLALRERPNYVEAERVERPSGVEQATARAEIPLFGGADTQHGWMLSLSAHSQVGRAMAHPKQATARRAFAVEVVDDSMSPRFEPGEIAYVAGGQMPRKGQDCLVEFADLTARILQFVDRSERTITFRQLNPPQNVTRQLSEKLQIHAIVGRG